MKHRWTDNLRSPIALLLFVGVAALGLTADLWSKAAAKSNLSDGSTVRFIPGWLHFTYTENRGAVFGLGQGQQALFLIVSVGAVGFLAFLFLTGIKSKIYQLILGVLMAGVLGNMYDRIFHGFVRDMIWIFPQKRWPAWLTARLPEWDWTNNPIFPWIFNVADTLLCTGVALMLLYSVFAPHSSRPGRGEEDRSAGLSPAKS